MEEVKTACASGASHVGFVFAGHLRRLDPLSASVLSQAAAPSTVKRVGVFVDEGVEDIMTCHRIADFDIAQLHGGESPHVCRTLQENGIGVWKGIRPRTLAEFRHEWDRFRGSVNAILVEGFSAAGHGGTGTPFPHQWIGEVDRAGTSLVLAGGLTPGNVGAAISACRPDIVDVSSGIEREPGVKSLRLIEDFLQATARVLIGEPEA